MGSMADISCLIVNFPFLELPDLANKITNKIMGYLVKLEGISGKQIILFLYKYVPHFVWNLLKNVFVFTWNSTLIGYLLLFCNCIFFLKIQRACLFGAD